MMTSRSGTRQTAPAAPLMDYEAGRSDPRGLLWAVGFSVVGLVVVFSLGAALMIMCRPPEYGEWGAWAILGFSVGVGLSLLGLTLAGLPMRDHLSDRKAHRRRLQEAFDLELTLRENAGGVVTHEEFEEFSLYAERPQDMILLIIALTRRAAHEPSFRPSIATLTGEGIWINRGASRCKLGNVGTSQARLILTYLSEAGFIDGRTDGASGKWAYTSADAAIERYESRRV